MAAVRILLDTNILARANPRARGPARKLLKAVTESSNYVLITSPFILAELERVLSYPRLQRIWPLTRTEIADYIGAIEAFSELVVPKQGFNAVFEFDAAPLLGDPDDNPILQTALLGRAEILCTLDQHFYKASVVQFCQNQGIKIQTDVELLTQLKPV